MNEKKDLTWLELIAAFLAMRDPDILALCGRADRWYTVNLVIMLGFTFLLILSISTYSLSTFFDVRAAFFAALLIALILIQFDRAFFGYDGDQQGAENGVFALLSQVTRILPRVFLSVFFAVGLLAIPLELRIQEGQIKQILEQEHRAANRPYVQALVEFDQQREHRIRAFEDELARLREEEKAKQLRLDELTREREKWRLEDVRQAREEYKEETGLDGRLEGKGKRYNYAILLRKQAAERLKSLGERLRVEKTVMQDLKQAIRDTQVRLTDLQQNQEADRRDYEDELQNSLTFTQMRDGVLIRWRALNQLHDDPQVGTAAQILSWVIRGSIACLELLPLIVKIFLTPPNLYSIRRRTAFGAETAQIVHEGNQKIHEARQRAADMATVELEQEPRTRPRNNRSFHQPSYEH